MHSYSYTSAFLRTFRKTSRMNYNCQIRAWIIALSVKSRTMKYRRSRAGHRLFYYITSIVNQGQPGTTKVLPPTQLCSVNRNNLRYIMTVNTNKQISCVNHDTLFGALINCRLVTNKT